LGKWWSWNWSTGFGSGANIHDGIAGREHVTEFLLLLGVFEDAADVLEAGFGDFGDTLGGEAFLTEFDDMATSFGTGIGFGADSVHRESLNERIVRRDNESGDGAATGLLVGAFTVSALDTDSVRSNDDGREVEGWVGFEQVREVRDVADVHRGTRVDVR